MRGKINSPNHLMGAVVELNEERHFKILIFMWDDRAPPGGWWITMRHRSQKKSSCSTFNAFFIESATGRGRQPPRPSNIYSAFDDTRTAASTPSRSHCSFFKMRFKPSVINSSAAQLRPVSAGNRRLFVPPCFYHRSKVADFFNVETQYFASCGMWFSETSGAEKI